MTVRTSSPLPAPPLRSPRGPGGTGGSLTGPTNLPTRPDATVEGLVHDVAHARSLDLSDEQMLDLLAVVADVLRDIEPADRDDPETIEQAAEEAVASFARTSPAYARAG